MKSKSIYSSDRSLTIVFRILKNQTSLKVIQRYLMNLQDFWRKAFTFVHNSYVLCTNYIEIQSQVHSFIHTNCTEHVVDFAISHSYIYTHHLWL